MGMVVDPAIVDYLTQKGRQAGKQAGKKTGKHVDRQAVSGKVEDRYAGR
jgi:hypothetical protein